MKKYPFFSTIICIVILAGVILGTVYGLRTNYGTYLHTVVPAAAAEGLQANGVDFIKNDADYDELKRNFYSNYPYALTAYPEVREKFIEKFITIEPRALEKYPWLDTDASEDSPVEEFDATMWHFVDLLDERFVIYPNRGIYYRTSTGAIPFAKF